MTTIWPFWNEKRISDVYENIYIRTFVEDWFLIVAKLAEEISNTGGDYLKILDIGCGEGHTAKQILDRVKKDYVCDLLETDNAALERAKSFLQVENKPGEIFNGGVEILSFKNEYNVIYTSHTNYYWGVNEDHYKIQLDNVYTAIKEGGKLLILTLPQDSAHYKVMLHQIYPEYNYSEYIENYYKSKGYNVHVEKFQMRIYVGDILNNSKDYDLSVFYKFIHNTNVYPDREKLQIFRKKLEEFSQNGYLDFADHLIVVEK